MSATAAAFDTQANPHFDPVVMVVDDEDSARLSLRYTLKDAYPNLFLCASSREAMDVIRNNRVHVAILDIKMVGESGLDLLSAIKTYDPFIECIMLTAFETQEHLREALRRGASEFLHKPPQISTVLAAVAKAVDARRSTERIKVAISRATAVENDFFVLQSGLIHDLRNQMTVVCGMIELIDHRIRERATLDESHVSGLRAELLTAQRAANVCISITSRHLDLLRAASASDEDSMSLYEVINGIADSLPFLPDGRKARCILTPPEPGMPTPDLAGSTIFQLLLNVILNAAQARKPQSLNHEVQVTVGVDNSPLDLSGCVDSPTLRWIGSKSFRNTPPLVRVTVTDNGTGIRPDVLGKMFGQNVSTKPTGTGVGLLLVGKVVTDNHLLLKVATNVGVGTTMTLYLPAKHPSTIVKAV